MQSNRRSFGDAFGRRLAKRAWCDDAEGGKTCEEGRRVKKDGREVAAATQAGKQASWSLGLVSCSAKKVAAQHPEHASQTPAGTGAGEVTFQVGMGGLSAILAC